MAPPSFPPDVVGIANLPNQQHQIAYRKGTNFNLMVVGGSRARRRLPLLIRAAGESGSGKTTWARGAATLRGVSDPSAAS